MVWSLKKFKHYIYGSEVILYTDHRALQYLQNVKENSKLIRWKFILAEFNCTVKFRDGVNNNADYLSRGSYIEDQNMIYLIIDDIDLRKEQEKDSKYQFYKNDKNNFFS